MILILSALVSAAHADVVTGRIYPMGKAGGEPLYTQTTEVKRGPDGRENQSSKIVDAKGTVVMTEQTVYQGTTLISQNIEQLQTKEAWELKVDGKKLTVRTFELKDGARKEVEKDTETISGSLISGPVARNFLREHWEKLMNGDTVKTRFVVMEIGGTVGFEFKKKAQTEREVTIEMRPSSFFVDMIVDPIEMVYDSVEKRMIRYRGRTPLKTLNGKKWDPVDSEIHYLWEPGNG